MAARDVIIVGAGPAGNYAAYCLARLGYDVLVLEEHEKIGEPVNCSGLIGAEAFERHDLPRRAILKGFDRARFIAPGGQETVLMAPQTLAYVVDRSEFDRSLADQAQAAGATYWLGHRCEGITPGDRNVMLTVKTRMGETLVAAARAVILATGVRYRLIQAVGTLPPRRFLHAAQTECSMGDVSEVEVYLGRTVSPGSFGWVIPLSKQRVKLGLCTEGPAMTWMDKLLLHPRIHSRLVDGRPAIKVKPIPISPAPRTALDRILLVGDAAGQVKPTTGGGISYGILCAELAAETLHQAMKRGRVDATSLARYERLWRQAIGRELMIGSAFRRMGGWLRDRQIDGLVRALAQPAWQELAQRTADFDHHSRFILASLVRPSCWWAFLTSWRARSLAESVSI
jgi:geranylgeranyl reductase family protein